MVKKKIPDSNTCTGCGRVDQIDLDEKTAFPSFKDCENIIVDYHNLHKFLHSTYEYKKSLKSQIEVLASFPYSEENKKKAEEQRKYILNKMNEVESYVIDMVIKMYIDTK